MPSSTRDARIASVQVWDIIERAKQDRAVVLTTHSMEEADILGDRIAIMARGNLRCLGTSLRLKQRFGAGYQVRLPALLRECVCVCVCGCVASAFAGGFLRCPVPLCGLAMPGCLLSQGCLHNTPCAAFAACGAAAVFRSLFQ